MPEPRALLALLRANPLDAERLRTWARAGFKSAAAARLRPDLGAPRTFQATVARYQGAISEAMEAIFAHCATTD